MTVYTTQFTLALPEVKITLAGFHPCLAVFFCSVNGVYNTIKYQCVWYLALRGLVYINSYKNWKVHSARSLLTFQSTCQLLFFVTLYVNAKLQFSNCAFPKSTNLGELVVVANMFWYVISFLLLYSICCVGFVANAVKATGAAKILEHCFCCCSVCRSQYTLTYASLVSKTGHLHYKMHRNSCSF